MALRPVNRSYAAEDPLGKLVADLGPDIVKELSVDRIHLEHTLCKVMLLSQKKTLTMLKNKRLKGV